MKRIAVLTLAFLIAACTTTGGTPQESLHQVKQTYAVAQSIAVLYAQQPFCGSPGATQLCADRQVVVQLSNADKVALNSIKAAEAAIKAGAPDAMTLLAAASAAATTLNAQAQAVKR